MHYLFDHALFRLFFSLYILENIRFTKVDDLDEIFKGRNFINVETTRKNIGGTVETWNLLIAEKIFFKDGIFLFCISRIFIYVSPIRK